MCVAKLAFGFRPDKVAQEMFRRVLKSCWLRTMLFTHEVGGTGGSHAQVTTTRPRFGSANCLKAPGLTSISVGLQPTPSPRDQLCSDAQLERETYIDRRLSGQYCYRPVQLVACDRRVDWRLDSSQ